MHKLKLVPKVGSHPKGAEDGNRHYGNSCIRCGYDDPRALTIDHVNQDGYKQRNSQGRRLSGTKLYKWLRVNNYPPGFRTLCMNCQFIVYNEHKSNE